MSGVRYELLAADSSRAIQSTEFWVTLGLLVLSLFIGAIILYFVDKWRKQQHDSKRDSTETLTSFRDLYEQGDITESEYQAVRDRVASRMRQEVGIGISNKAEEDKSHLNTNPRKEESSSSPDPNIDSTDRPPDRPSG